MKIRDKGQKNKNFQNSEDRRMETGKRRQEQKDKLKQNISQGHGAHARASMLNPSNVGAVREPP